MTISRKAARTALSAKLGGVRVPALFGIGTDAKTVKGEKFAATTGIAYLQPSAETCPWASAGCSTLCLNGAGRGRMSPVQSARAHKAAVIFAARRSARDELDAYVAAEVAAVVRAARRRSHAAYIRPNGTSDLPWLRALVARHAGPLGAVVYDYTKAPCNPVQGIERGTLAHLTRSFDGTKWLFPKDGPLPALTANANVAFAYRGEPLQADTAIDVRNVYGGWAANRQHASGGDRVVLATSWIDGDASDLRPLDPFGVYVALRLKPTAASKAAAPSPFVLEHVGGNVLHWYSAAPQAWPEGWR